MRTSSTWTSARCLPEGDKALSRFAYLVARAGRSRQVKPVRPARTERVHSIRRAQP